MPTPNRPIVGLSPSELRDELAFQAGVKPNELSWENVPHLSLKRPNGEWDYDPSKAEGFRKFYTAPGYVAPSDALKPHEIAKMWDMVQAGLVPMSDYAKARNLTYGVPAPAENGAQYFGLKPWEESPGVSRTGAITPEMKDFYGLPTPTKSAWNTPEDDALAERTEAWTSGSDAWWKKQRGEGQWAQPTTTSPQVTIPKSVTDQRKESFAPAPDTSPDSPQVLPQQQPTAPRINVPQAIFGKSEVYAPSANSVASVANPANQQPAATQQPATVNFGPQLPGQRQVYNWAGPQIKLPAEITDQLPQPIVPTQGATPTIFSPQAASTAPTAQAQFQPPKNIPIPDLSQLQSSTPSSNNLFATINGLQNRSRTTAPNKSGFYGGFY